MGRPGNGCQRNHRTRSDGAATGKVILRPGRTFASLACVEGHQGGDMTRACCSCTVVVAFAVLLAAVAAEDTYVLDPVHSQPIGEVRQMGYCTQHGAFTR